MEEFNIYEKLEESLRIVWQRYHHFIIPSGHDLSPLQLFLLRFIHSRQISTPSEIAAEFGVTLGAVTGLIDRLIKLELVDRQRSEEDRRLVLIKVTPKGEEIIFNFEEERIKKLSLISSELGSSTMKDLTNLLTMFGQVLEELQTREKNKT